MGKYTPFTSDGVQTIGISVPGWAEPYTVKVYTAREAIRTVHDAIDYWQRYSDNIEFTYYGYDPNVYGDDGEVIGTDGMPDAIGKFNPTTDQVEWEQQ